MKLIQEKTNSQSGRSMVEMLGVLAIIGVLSIGGVAGYRYAIQKYHASQLMNSVVIGMLQYLNAYHSGLELPSTSIAWSDSDKNDFFPNLIKLKHLYNENKINVTTTTQRDGPYIVEDSSGISLYLRPNDDIWIEFCQLSPALDELVTKFQSLGSGNEKTIYCSDCATPILNWHIEYCSALFETCKNGFQTSIKLIYIL